LCKSLTSIGLLLAIAFLPLSQAGFASWLSGGVPLPDCDVTHLGQYVCKDVYWGNPPGGDPCNDHLMQTTSGYLFNEAQYLEIPPNDNCSNFFDSAGDPCENYANEPTNTRCIINTYGI
jgi:hypothetical protein